MVGCMNKDAPATWHRRHQKFYPHLSICPYSHLFHALPPSLLCYFHLLPQKWNICFISFHCPYPSLPTKEDKKKVSPICKWVMKETCQRKGKNKKKKKSNPNVPINKPPTFFGENISSLFFFSAFKRILLSLTKFGQHYFLKCNN